MSGFTLSVTSERRLIGVNHGLSQVVRWSAARCPPGWTFNVSEGLRTLARQKQLFAAGLSRTLDSYHLTGHAVDLAVIVAGKAIWKREAFEPLNALMQAGGKALGVPLEWGGNWVTLVDCPHWQTERG